MKRTAMSSDCLQPGVPVQPIERGDDVDGGGATTGGRELHRERWITAFGILFTLVTTAGAVAELGGDWLGHVGAGEWGEVAAQSVFLLIILFLIYGGLVYQLTRLAYLTRRLRHRQVPREALESLYDGEAPSLTILVPSYKEDESVVAKTLLSAALQDYPRRRVVLLIDDPPDPTRAEDVAGLEAARALPGRVQEMLCQPARVFAAAREDFRARLARYAVDPVVEVARLAGLYDEAASWFEARAADHPLADHADALFVERVLRDHARAHRARADALRAREEVLTGSELLRQYRRLAAIFTVEVTSFERKRYQNLSHEPNKAMNLNSYIGLVGGRWQARQRPDGLHLEEAAEGPATLEVPDTDYFITLDADSLLVPDYALRLIHLMEQPEHRRTAVAQTPYSAIPSAPGMLERVAGATTDIQYIIHQGFTGFGATYWVGANALLRRSALADIAVTEEERGFPVTRFIQDRTVIEDTESSVDLVARGWQLYNYPERMAYSATPPDFGSLIIQRRRWANGGLIILPKLLRYLLSRPRRQRRAGEGFMRVHYLSSIAAVNVGLLVLLAFPFSGSIESVWVPLTAVPYFFLYGRDLVGVGYRASDLFRVYALNLLLIPVNLGGVLKSLQQGWTGKKIPFGRTPKVSGRTAAAPLYVIAAWALVLHWLVGAGVDFVEARWAHGAFAVVNAGFLLYALVWLVGLREAKEDVYAGLRRARSRATKAAEPVPVPAVTWVPAVPTWSPATAVAVRPAELRGRRGAFGRERYFYKGARREDCTTGWFFYIRGGAVRGPYPSRAAAERACVEFTELCTGLAMLGPERYRQAAS
jgi:cellulose synthase/poly-beta-1,6-N-acetylglucosamine synthase-like glycosyltransferase